MAQTYKATDSGPDDALDQFPDLPGYEAAWVPVYWEPIMLSGERIAALIAAVGADGEYKVEIILRPGVLKVLYPGQHKKALGLLSLVKESIEEQLIASKGIEGISVPMSGFYTGQVFPGLSTSIHGVINQAKSLCSSLSGAVDLDEYERPDSLEHETHDRWCSSIKKRVEIMLPRLEVCFAKTFLIMEGARKTEIDFVGQKLAANFGRLIPSSLSRSLRDAKSQVLDLAALRDQMARLNNNEKFMLMVWMPKERKDGGYGRHFEGAREAFLELETEAEKVGLVAEPFHAAEDVAQRICTVEAAA